MSRSSLSNLDEILSPRFIIEGATPQVNPKNLSNSEIQFQSENSNIDSMRSLNQDVKNNSKLIQRNSQMFSINLLQLQIAKSKSNIACLRLKIAKMENQSKF
ncbi:unnamed protein product [Paramecium octaurelia]|uniref:Uncharacterized protein n=1 Tax=Paramecium octaurelia TaxID=43137 RepID=A0A8S1VLX4_PAROT|nr:unnamed protein product [Paramecium octaurelia]